MTKLAEAKSSDDIAKPLNITTQVMDDSEPTGREYKLGEVAMRCGIHRVTLLRMEQNNQIPKARWRRKPQPHRVYTEAEIEVIRKIVESKGDADGRSFID